MTYGKIGLLFVGLRGPTAATAAAALHLMRNGGAPQQFGVTSTGAFDNVDLPDVDEFLVGGWDLSDRPAIDAVHEYGIPGFEKLNAEAFNAETECWPGICTALDIPREASHTQRIDAVGTFAACSDEIGNRIAGFTRTHSLDQCIVVYLGSPAKRCSIDLNALSVLDASGLDAKNVPAGLIYALGAIRAGAHFIDFTPSETLDMVDLRRLAAESGSVLAGRDGSTGQTYLKMVLASALLKRGFDIKSWYSTNILGNHDGYVLGLAGHGVTKIDDKLAGLDTLTANSAEHVVRIEKIGRYGDRKEAWDAVELEGFLGVPVSLRINWRSWDSLLAAPLILDVCRLVALAGLRGDAGLCRELAFFFKRPIDATSLDPAIQYADLLNFVAHFSRGPKPQGLP